jgi:hypothetical protein
MALAAPPAALGATLRALNAQENQRLALELLRSPETREAIDALTRVLTRSLAAGVRRDLGPALAAALRDALRAGLDDELRRATRGMTRGAAEGLRDDLGPALRALARDPENQSAVRAAARSIGREVVLGSDDAMASIQRAQERGGRPSMLSRLASMTESGAMVMKVIAGASALLAAVLAVWVARLLLRARRVAMPRARPTVTLPRPRYAAHHRPHRAAHPVLSPQP